MQGMTAKVLSLGNYTTNHLGKFVATITSIMQPKKRTAEAVLLIRYIVLSDIRMHGLDQFHTRFQPDHLGLLLQPQK